MIQEKQTAFTQAYNRCQQRFERYCVALAYGKMDAQDLIQDVLLSTYERFEQIKHKDQLLHYMIRTARNKSISQWRRARFQTKLQEKHTRELFAQGITPDMALDVQLLYSKMESLPDKQRDAIILFDICGFSIREVANIQQTQENTVKSHLRRGRKKLQQLLHEKPRSRWLAGLLITPPEVSKIGFGSFKQFIFQLKPITMYSLSSIVVAGSLSLMISLNSIPSAKSQHLAKPIIQQLSQKSTLATMFPIRLKQRTNPETEILIPKQSQSVDKFATPQKPTYASLPTLAMPEMVALKQLGKQTPPILKHYLPLIAKPIVHKNKSFPSCDSTKFIGSVTEFKKRLLQKLKRDRLIRSKKAKNRINFKGTKVFINKKPIPEALQQTYKSFLTSYGVEPCENRFVQTGKKYIAIGVVIEKRFEGTLRLNGKVDIDSFVD